MSTFDPSVALRKPGAKVASMWALIVPAPVLRTPFPLAGLEVLVVRIV